MRSLGLDESSKSVRIPGVKEGPAVEEGYVDGTTFRAMVARANYLAQDRGDTQFVVKAFCRKMSKPEMRYWASLKRLGRYLLGEPRRVRNLEFQPQPTEVVMWSETDFAGCRETRKSTSGGVGMWGNRCLKSWSSTQDFISHSSGQPILTAS